MTDLINQEFFAILLFVFLAIFLLSGYPVALTLTGTAIIVGLLGFLLDLFPLVLISVLPNRVFGILTNDIIDAATQTAEDSGALRLISLLEGGYDLNALGESVCQHMDALEGV